MGLRGGSGLYLSARRGSSFPGLARSPLPRRELGMASPVLPWQARGRPSPSRGLGGQLKSSQLLKELFKGRLTGASEETRGPSPCCCRGPWCPCLGSALAGSQGQLGKAGRSRKHPRRAQRRGSRRGKCTLQAKFVSGEIGLSCETQRSANLMLLDKECPFWKRGSGGQCSGSRAHSPECAATRSACAGPSQGVFGITRSQTCSRRRPVTAALSLLCAGVGQCKEEQNAVLR